MRPWSWIAAAAALLILAACTPAATPGGGAAPANAGGAARTGQGAAAPAGGAAAAVPGGAQASGGGAHRIEVLVAAAASLQDALQAAAAAFAQDRPDVAVRFTFGSSGALAQQIAAGAPVDLFVAAGQAPMDQLVRQGVVDPGAVRSLAGNQVVLVAPRAGGPPIRGWDDLRDPRVRRIAVGDPAHVPAGQYGRQVLEHLGLWDAVQPKLVLDQDVRQVLHHVAVGEAQAGIVYATDAATSPQVTVVAPAPAGSHKPVVYPMAVVRTARQPAAAQALAGFLLSDRGQALLQRYGFTPSGAGG